MAFPVRIHQRQLRNSGGGNHHQRKLKFQDSDLSAWSEFIEDYKKEKGKMETKDNVFAVVVIVGILLMVAAVFLP